VLFGVGDDPFASDGALKAADSAFNTLVIVNLYSCHSKNLHLLTNDYTSRPGPRRFHRLRLRDCCGLRYLYWLCAPGGILYNVSARSSLALDKIVARRQRM
jgi:hypothetical protein